MKARVTTLWALGLLFTAVLSAVGESAAWFSGGSYDGYENAGVGLAINRPQVNNAGGATGVTEVSAWLNGMLLYTGGAPASVTVYWGKDPDELTSNHVFGEVGEREALTHQVTVDPRSTYYYRFYAQNTALEEGWAPSSATFTTLALAEAPEVGARAGARPVGRTSATLNGELLAGWSAAITFTWGSDPNPENWTNSASLDDRPEGAVRLTVSGLLPGTTYYYRIKAENDYGEDTLDPLETFTTVSGLAGFGGGSYDGFDLKTIAGILRSAAGTVFTFR